LVVRDRVRSGAPSGAVVPTIASCKFSRRKGIPNIGGAAVEALRQPWRGTAHRDGSGDDLYDHPEGPLACGRGGSRVG